MQPSIEVNRTVSLLRGLLRKEIHDCGRAIEAGDAVAAQKQLNDAHDKVVRAINALNRLRA